ncbi:hypothetical protein LOTGIDRAFT_164358 [Lottia gigantea]|uniref:Uncharacterized protein n=1 Tax=Lottia gigantea TaxID=225164 RepID=V4A4Y6_LOTGI|nr:hypothetical protein LOTGIDRAFT_164358 [Lottia gigantea]ESO90055.1 hypothetical protein LOTGIDRAFT_164358 [Lottia gigantea]
MALSVRYHANNMKNKRPTFSDEDHDGDSAGYETDNTYESIHFIPNKTPQVVPYQCVDIKRLINQRHNLESRPRDVEVELARHEDNLLRGYKYEFWRKSNEGNRRPKTLDLGQKQISDGVTVENMYNAKLSCRNDRVYSKCGPGRGQVIGQNTKNKHHVELYGRHFGLVGTIPYNEDGLYGFTSERYGFGEILYKPCNEFYHSSVDRNRDLLERYGYDVNDTDYVLNDPREAVNDVERNGYEFGGNETDNTYESINIQSDLSEFTRHNISFMRCLLEKCLILYHERCKERGIFHFNIIHNNQAMVQNEIYIKEFFNWMSKMCNLKVFQLKYFCKKSQFKSESELGNVEGLN